jgi:hypothetical protein
MYLQHVTNLVHAVGHLLACLGEGKQFQSALFFKIHQACFLHFLQNLDNVRIRAVDGLCKRLCIHGTFRILQAYQHHGRLLAEEHIEYFLVFQVQFTFKLYERKYTFQGIYKAFAYES